VNLLQVHPPLLIHHLLDSLKHVDSFKSLFGTNKISPDFLFVKTALRLLESEPGRSIQYTSDDDTQTLSLTAPSI
jgi:hypothetical protein